MNNRIEAIFAQRKSEKRKVLIGYITAGFPTKSSLRKLVPLLAGAGVDLLEIGVPFSDPIADGPTIQHSSQIALKNGVSLRWIFESVKTLRKNGVTLPLVLMSYCNPIYSMGIEQFFETAKAVGVDGLIIPDMIPEESSSYARFAKRFEISLISLVAPTSPKNRIQAIAARTTGFLYAVSMTGVTGVQKALPAQVAGFLKSVKSASHTPVAVGFGITSPDQARLISKYADGVIVGSELIRQIEVSKDASFFSAVRFVKSLRSALDKEPSHAS